MCVAAFVVSPAAADAPSPFAKGPYLQALTSDSVEIRVELSAPAPITVTVGAQGRDAGAPRTVQDATSATFHAVHVAGLAPSTHYSYSVRAAGKEEKGELTTAPKPDSRDPFTFTIYGDNRTDDAAHASIVRAISQSSADFLINTGDYVQMGSADALWQAFFDIEGSLLRSHCVFATVGNHELTDAQGTNYLRYFGPTVDSHGEDEKPKLYGSYRWGDARFFVLDAMESFDEGPERAWLEDELARADAEPGLVWRIAVTHHGPWSAGPHGGNERMLRAGIPALLEKHHVDLIVAGHDHIYERGQSGALRYVISGGGGAPLYPIDGPVASTRKAESAHHFVEATVKPDSLAIVAKRDDGSVLERCSFTKSSAGWDCDPPPAPKKAQRDTSAPASPGSTSAQHGGCATGTGAPAGAAPFAFVAFALSLAARRRARNRG